MKKKESSSFEFSSKISNKPFTVTQYYNFDQNALDKMTEARKGDSSYVSEFFFSDEDYKKVSSPSQIIVKGLDRQKKPFTKTFNPISKESFFEMYKWFLIIGSDFFYKGSEELYEMYMMYLCCYRNKWTSDSEYNRFLYIIKNSLEYVKENPEYSLIRSEFIFIMNHGFNSFNPPTLDDLTNCSNGDLYCYYNSEHNNISLSNKYPIKIDLKLETPKDITDYYYRLITEDGLAFDDYQFRLFAAFFIFIKGFDINEIIGQITERKLYWLEDINYKALIERFWLDRKYQEDLNDNSREQIGMSHQELINEERAAYNLPPEESDPYHSDLYD